jgi:hypothetical protein
MIPSIARLSVRLVEGEDVSPFGDSLVMGDAREEPAAGHIRMVGQHIILQTC